MEKYQRTKLHAKKISEFFASISGRSSVNALHFDLMAKPKPKERHKAAKAQDGSSTEAQKSQPVQPTKVEKRQARHDALLNSILPQVILD